MTASATASGKTFTVANLIALVNRPTLVLSHNPDWSGLAAQLYAEFKSFLPRTNITFVRGQFRVRGDSVGSSCAVRFAEQGLAFQFLSGLATSAHDVTAP